MVTVYTKNNCPKCMMTKNVLGSEGIPFQIINIDEDLNPNEREKKIQHFKGLGFMSMPIVIKDGMSPDDYISGFNPEKLQLLKEDK
ncbi:hypothetical protein KO561_02530 [Radiobacillus kanasensis]|uniref:glutaredoxin domain-containing protein n=1 Tax=Radiobacillus kanasensis TaxID=2844358 RepID=UPI001E3CD8E6|nr:glutaredoxin domain-containing protein [Radiobacillus kanasensis]UFT99856.1 hypothetical protein KO561_02530 [Radiobacillus kanasensis]